MMKLIKQAQDIQKKMKDMQVELDNMEFTGEAASGAVKVICDGQGRFKSIKLSAEAINPEDPSAVDTDSIEMLEDLITTAMKQATTTSIENMEVRMKSLTGGVNIPGLM